MLSGPIPVKYIPRTFSELEPRILELEEVIFQRHIAKNYGGDYQLYFELLKAYKIFRENDTFTNNVVKILFFED